MSDAPTTSDPAKRHSAALTDGPDRAGARAMLKAIGFTDEDLARPLVGVATTWIETMPCNLNQRRLAEHVKAGIRAAGGTPMEFNTVAISDGVTMGTEGMKTSLVSREVVADSMELVTMGQMFDGLVALVRCDVRPSSIVTREALENGIASVAATGGSTNGVLHMLAIAHEFGIPLDIDEFGAIAERTPLIGDMRPGGRYTATDMFEAGGVALVMRELLKRPGLLHGDQRTVDG